MICIYSDSRNIYGGVEVIVSRFAKFLAERDVQFFVVEKKNTRLAAEIRWADIVDPDNLNLYRKKIDYVFFPSVVKLRYRKIVWKVFKNAKISAWIVHPNDVFRGFIPFSGKIMDFLGYKSSIMLRNIFENYYTKVEDLFSFLIENDGLFVMDGATARSFSYFYPKITKSMPVIPVPSPTFDFMLSPKNTSKSISVGYIGRVDDFKYSALEPFVKNQLSVLSQKTAVSLHLVGVGSKIPDLLKICAKNNVFVHNYGFLPNSRAREIVCHNSNFAATMGTSALDISGSGLPCIILDPAMNRFSRKQKLFRFVSEIDDFTLGEYRDFPFYNQGKHDFLDIVDMIFSDHSVAFQCYDYVKKNHDPENVFSVLFDSITASTVNGAEVELLYSQVNSNFDRLRFFCADLLK